MAVLLALVQQGQDRQSSPANACLFTVLRWSPGLDSDPAKGPIPRLSVAAGPKVTGAMKAEGLIQ
jgi:hypothetical protein